MNCLLCEREFIPKRKTAQFCSTTCRVRANQTKEFIDRKSLDEEQVITKARQAMDELNKTLAAKGLPLMVMASDLPPVKWIKTGIPELDELTGGFPRKKITEIFGAKGVGKTTLMSRMVGNLDGLRVCYIDAENGLPNPPDNVEVNNEFMLEKVQEIVEEALLADTYDLIVVDSVATMVPRAEIEGDPGDAHMGLKARLMSQWMRRINFYLSKSNTAVVFINQQRETMNMWGLTKFTPGGYALGYAASLRLELKCNKADKKEDYQTVTVIVEKSRFSRPYLETKFKLYY